MVRKTDKPPKAPNWHEWKEQVLTRTAPWCFNNRFVTGERDWTIEEYLEWCEEQYPLSKRNEKIRKKLDVNPKFNTIVAKLRERFRAVPSELRAMSKDDWISWYSHRMPIDPETREDVRASCLRLRLTPRWQDFLLSCAFFDDGRGGYEEISSNFDDCFGDASTGLVEVSFYVHPYLTQRDLLEGLWPFIKDMKSLMYGPSGDRLRLTDSQYLVSHLGQKEEKEVAEIDQILNDVLDGKPLDESIRRAFPGQSEECLKEFVLNILKDGWDHAEIRSRLWRMHQGLRLRSVEAGHPLETWDEERHAIELYKLRRRRYHY